MKSASAQIQQLTTERDAAQSKLNEERSTLEATNAELQKVKEAAEQANARTTESENMARGAETQRNELKATIDKANAEIERLKSELEKQKVNPPEQGESVPPVPGERRL